MTSSAVVGSSAKRIVGPQASAIAIVTRWRMPPDSWCGYSSSRRVGSGMPTDVSKDTAVCLASLFDMCRWYLSDSVICRPIFITGLSDVIGSWKIIAISVPQISRIAGGARSPISWPSNATRPSRTTLRLGSSPMTERDRIVLPDPDSPTMPIVLPRSSVNETPSTARTMPRSVRKWVLRSSTSSSGPVAVRWSAMFLASCPFFTRQHPGSRSAWPRRHRSC